MKGKPRHITWTEVLPDKGPAKAKMYSKEYQNYRFKGGAPETWPGIEELAVPDRETAQEFIRNGVPRDVLLERDGPSRFVPQTFADRATNLRGSDNPGNGLQHPHTSSKDVGNAPAPGEVEDDVYADRQYPTGGDAFVRLPMDLVRALKVPPHLGIFFTLLRHATMRSRTRLKLNRKFWEEAGVNGKDARSRAIKTLEAKGAIRVERASGRAPVVSLNIDKRGRPRLWKQATDPNATQRGGIAKE